MNERRSENVVAPGEIKQPLILTLDVGTSSVRALAFDAYGRQLSGVEGRATYDPVTTPDGGFELDIENLVRGTTECFDQAVQQLETHHLTVAAVAMDTFWHNLIALGPGGVPLTQVITWADTRSTAAVEELRREIDERELHSRTGCVLHSSYWPAKLRWLRRANPDLFNAARHWVSIGEYLVWRFCGAWSCSVSMASGTGLLDQNRCDWDPELLEVLGLSSALLSPLQSGRSSVGTLTNTWAERWPLLRGVPWFPAAGDGACSNIGSGCATRDRVALMIGTSGALRVCFEARQVPIQWGLWCYHAVPSYFLLGGALSNGGLLWEWLLRTFRVDTDSDLEEVVASVPPDGHGLTVLPFLAG
ncbi:MAG: gluconokinase, partial [Chloroflexi bacterium]|nr:gluconokinase [Chloroflexota bacterium]